MQKVLLVFILVCISAGYSLQAQNPFGDGRDGALLVSTGDTYLLDQVSAGLVGESVAGSMAITLSNTAAFSQLDEIFIYTVQDSNPDSSLNQSGRYEFARIQTIVGNVVYLAQPLEGTFGSTEGRVTQVVRVNQFTDVTINGTLTCEPWNGETGGVLVFRASGTVLVSADGKILANGKGFRAKNRQADNTNGVQGEGIFGFGGAVTSANSNGGGGGANYYGGGGGGGHAFVGTAGNGASSTPGAGGLAVGAAELPRFYFGGSGGTGGDNDSNSATNPNSGAGGGLVYISANQITNFGLIQSNGLNAPAPGANNDGGSGGGAGGTVYLRAYTVANDSVISVSAGNGYASQYPGGAGSVGRIRIDDQVLSGGGAVTPAAYAGDFYGIFHNPLNSVADVSGPYTVNAGIVDQQGDAITEAKLYYRVNTGSYVQTALSLLSGFNYTAAIPGQSAGSVIQYYLFASDGSNSYYLPEGAPAKTYSFEVSGLAPSNFSVTDLSNGVIRLTWKEPADLLNLQDYKIYRSEIEGFIPGPGNLLATVSDTFYLDNTASDFHTYYYRVGANYGFSVELTPAASLLVNNTSQTTIIGYAYLENASNHANIKIKFNPISPSAVLDSTYTNALGYFETHINPGIYTITYEKANYQTYYRLENTSIIADLNLGERTILALGNTNISGNVSGIWNGLYTISGNITVPTGDSLTILAGSQIRFLGNYNLYVYGYLNVAGEENDSVMFTSAPANQIFANGQWQGIDFYNSANDQSMIQYAIIRYAVDGVYFEEASPTLEHSRIYGCSDVGIQMNGNTANPLIRYCEVHNSGYGLYCYDGQPTVENVYAHHNTNYGLYWDYNSYGSIIDCEFSYNNSHGMYIYNTCSPLIEGCTINNNNSWGIRVERYSNPIIRAATVMSNNGYGISMYYDGYSWHSPIIEDCVIESNASWGLFLRHHMTPASIVRNNRITKNGGGLYMYYEIDAQIYNNYIVGNNNAGIYFDYHYNDCQIHHNVIAHNNGDGIYKNSGNSYPTISYNTIYKNTGDGFENNNTANTSRFTNNIVADNNGYGIRNTTSILSFEYNNVFSNGLGELLNLTNLPVNAWDFVSYNAQNDTADIYLNISEDPQFKLLIDTADVRLTSASPCINTGNPTTKDPDDSNSDLGAWYFDLGNPHQLSVIEYGNQSVKIGWEEIDSDTLSAYKVYYKLSSESSYIYFATTSNLELNINGLTNDLWYDFTVSGLYSSYESGYAEKVSARPGVPQMSWSPSAFNLSILSDTVTQVLTVNNSGSRELNVQFPKGLNPGATHFDGSGDYINYPDQNQLESFSEFTIECWIYREANGHFEFISKNYRQYSLYISEQNRLGLYKAYTSDFYQSITSTYVLPANEWHHIAIVWKGTSVKFYADGELVDEVFDIVSTNVPNLTYYLALGCRANDYNYYFKGFLSEVRIWNQARSQSDIFRYMRSSLSGSESGLVCYLPLQNDYLDKTSYGISGSVGGNVYRNSEQISPFVSIPQVLPGGETYNVPAGGSLQIPFKYYPTGQNGTFVYMQPVYSTLSGNDYDELDIALTYGQVVPSTPVHFSSVAETGIPYPIVIKAATIDGVNLAVGDEIGVYDGNLCVGAGIFNGTFNFVVTVWKADPQLSLAGYTDGNSMHFVIYDASADLEATVEATYLVGDGTFGYGAFTAVNLSSSVYQIQEVPISGNAFSLISFNKLPRYSSSAIVFGQLDNLQIAYNDQGFAFIPPYNINTLGDIYFKDGFHLFSTQPDTIYFEGTRINPLNWPIQVDAGKWNSIAYLGENPMSVGDAFLPGIVDSISIVQSSDGGAWIPSLALNTLGDLTPGKGYQVALSSASNINIIYQTNNAEVSKAVVPDQNPVHFTFQITGKPYQIAVELAGMELQGLVAGDELAVFDGEQCVGAVVLNGADRQLLTAWCSDGDFGLKGFQAGSRMRFIAYGSQGEQVLATQGMNQNDNVHFNASDYAHIKLVSKQFASASSVYPNPFTESTRVYLELEEAGEVIIQLSDLSGRIIGTLHSGRLNSGTHQFDWNARDGRGNPLPAGIYLMDVWMDNHQMTHKLIKF